MKLSAFYLTAEKPQSPLSIRTSTVLLLMLRYRTELRIDQGWQTTRKGKLNV